MPRSRVIISVATLVSSLFSSLIIFLLASCNELDPLREFRVHDDADVKYKILTQQIVPILYRSVNI